LVRACSEKKLPSALVLSSALPTTAVAVTLEQMTNALMVAVENPVEGRRVVTVPEIRLAGA
jgi:hypothetical protein